MSRHREDEAGALYAVPLADFIRTRAALAAKLRKAGRTREAAEVKRLRKPSVPVWVVNQLAHEEPRGVQDFLGAVETLRRAQLRSGTDLRQASDEQRGATRRLLERAEAVMRRAGVAVSPALLVRISGTLLGAAVDRETREDLRAGLLTSERTAPGFDAFAGATPHRTATSERARARDAKRRSPGSSAESRTGGRGSAKSAGVPTRTRLRLVKPADRAAPPRHADPSKEPSRAASARHRAAPAHEDREAADRRRAAERERREAAEQRREAERQRREEARRAHEADRAALAEVRAHERQAAGLERRAAERDRRAAKAARAVDALERRLEQLEERSANERQAADEAARDAREVRERASAARSRMARPRAEA